MQVYLCDINTDHPKGEFCERLYTKKYGIFRFDTPFKYEKDGKMHEGMAREILVNTPNSVIYHGAIDKNSSYVNDWIYFGGSGVEELFEKYPFPLNTAFLMNDESDIAQIISRISRELSSSENGYEDVVNCLLTQLIICIHRGYVSGAGINCARERIEKVRARVLKNIEQNWTLEKMADISGYSPSRFSALYNETFGCSPINDLLSQRINYAKKLLKYSNLSIENIAVRCGFKCVYYFSKYFKKQTSYPPSVYRKSVR